MTIIGKRTESFKGDSRRNLREALEDPGADLRASGGPLVEGIGGDDGRGLLAPVWIGDAARVSVCGPERPRAGVSRRRTRGDRRRSAP